MVIDGKRFRVRYVPGRHYLKRGRLVEHGDVIITDGEVVIGAKRGSGDARHWLSETVIYLKRHPDHVLN